jgi:ribosomal protein S18 acetylase RimI-like enzyme
MSLPDPEAPWFGLDTERLRALEAHQARALAIPGRAWRDFGDAVMLYSAAEKDPFFNRLVAVRWPTDPVAFDARLRQACELFTALERRPHLWAIPGLSRPADLIARLAANGFLDEGGGYDMVLVRPPGAPIESLPEGAVLEHWHASPEAEITGRAESLAAVVGESFEIPPARNVNLAREIGLTMTRPDFHAYVVKIDGRPVATGQRYTFDGASYLSSIGTRPAWRGMGLGTHITRRLAADSLAEGVSLIYLGVYADNLDAIRLYERLGFAILGGRSADMLARAPNGSSVRRPSADHSQD